MADQLKQYQGTVLAQGYGIVGKAAMRDHNLEYAAKAIYAYLATYGNTAFPGRDLICLDLGMSKNTYTKHMRSLITNGYITITQEKSGGKFGHNVYHINQVIMPCTKICDTAKNNESPCTKICDTEIWDTEICDTNSTSSNSTSSNNNTTTTDENVVVPLASLEEDDTEKKLTEAAAALGIKKTTLQKHVQQYGVSIVVEKMALLKKTISSGKKIVNPGAWLTTAIKEDYTDHEAAAAAKRAADREKAAAFQKAAEEALRKENEKTAIDPTSPFAKIAARIGAIKVG